MPSFCSSATVGCITLAGLSTPLALPVVNLQLVEVGAGVSPAVKLTVEQAASMDLLLRSS